MNQAADPRFSGFIRVFQLGFIFTAVGAFTLVCQTLFFREYLTSFRGNEFGVAFFFSSWMFWIAVSALVAAKARSRFRLERYFIPAILLFPPVAAAQAVLVVGLRLISHVNPYELFPFGRLLVYTFVVNAPVSLLSGTVFTMGCVFVSRNSRVQTQDADRIATRAYAFEALGSCIGGATVTALLWFLVPPLSLFVFASLFLVAAVLFLSWVRRSRANGAAAAALLGAVLVVYFSPIRSNIVEFLERLRWRTTLPEARLLETIETPYQQVSVAALRDQKLFLANGSVVATTAEQQRRKQQAAFLNAQRPGARRILVIGLGSEALIPELLRYDAERVDLVTTDAGYHRAVLPYYDERVKHALRDRRVNLFFGDVRDFILHKKRNLYDLVAIDLPEPDTASINRFYTSVFYRLVAGLLDERGVFATQITSGENYAGAEVVQYGRSIFNSLRGVFDEVIVTPGERAWIFASRSKNVISLDPAVLIKRFNELDRRDVSISPEIFRSLIQVERVASTQERFRGLDNQFDRLVQNTEDKPITFLLSLLVSIKRAGLSVGRLLDSIRALGFIVFILPIVIFVFWRLVYRGLNQTHERALAFNGVALTTAYGGVSISLCILLLLAFQSRFGHLFISIGLLSALFMLGLFLGGLGGGRVLGRLRNRTFLWPVAAVLTLSSALCLGLPHIVESLSSTPYSVALLVYHLTCFAAGVFSGSAFPVAGYYLRDAKNEVGAVAGVLESMDHLGGAIGAALVGIFVVPILGIFQTCIFLFCCLLAIGFLFVVEHPVVRRLFSAAARSTWYRRWRVRIAPRRNKTGRRALVYIATGSVVCLGLISNMIVSRLSAPRVDLDLKWIKTRFLATDVERREKPFVHYLTRGGRTQKLQQTNDAKGAFREAVFASRAVVPDIEGYGGPINLLIAIGSEERLREVSLIESNETPAYIYDINRWFKQFEGWPLNRPIQLDENVDALTGATITSRAATRIIDACRVQAARKLFDRRVKSAVDTEGSPRISLRAFVLIAAFLLAIVLFFKGNQLSRTVLLWSSFAVFGLMTNFQFSMVHVTRIAAFDLPSIDTGELFILTAGVLLLALGFGQIYCGYLCPFGAAQEILSRLGFVRKPNREGGPLRSVKFWILTAVLLVFFVVRSDSITAFDPLQTVFGQRYNRWTVPLLITIGVFSLLYFRFFCRYLCPAGAFLALFNRFALFIGFARPKAYSDCDLGVRARWDVDCIQCNRCIEARSARIALGSASKGSDAAPSDAEKGDDDNPATPWLRDRWNLLLLVGVLTTIGIAFGSMHSRSDVDQLESFERARQVDTDQIRKQIQEDNLSDHEALFYTKPSRPKK